MASFLLMSFPAISQSVTVINGDTLICFPEPMVRQIMVDLETGDFCQQEKQSYLRDIGNLRKLMAIREQEYENTVGRLNDCKGVVKEKDLQIPGGSWEIKEAPNSIRMAKSGGIGYSEYVNETKTFYKLLRNLIFGEGQR